ncbi:hypothetical protein NPIL_516081 [Nephila pilipes]|uniref:Uncharacterized protein n=1 Tax=Nephila pilipes TaxID=299642 RepID=A0A8X6MRX5_NEPPI|nr:hypothetical protein NPIL_516081 [Nephila pilipes]
MGVLRKTLFVTLKYRMMTYGGVTSNRRKRVQELSEGLPGESSLAPPLKNEDNLPPQPEDDNEEFDTRVDIERTFILDSFVETLDALLEVDDIQEAFPTFEKLLENLTTTVQEYFHLVPKSFNNNQNNNSSRKSSKQDTGFDTNNAQEVQKLYKWNRHRCVRNLVLHNNEKCQAQKDELFEYFSKCWSSPKVPFSFPSSSPPDLPPVLDLLTPEAIFYAYKVVRIRLLSQIS